LPTFNCYNSVQRTTWDLCDRASRPIWGQASTGERRLSAEDTENAEKRKFRETAAKYRAKSVALFGSSLSPDKESRDIDIGVEGIEEKDFFTFYSELMCALSKPVDVVDLSAKSSFVDLIQREGKPLDA